MKTSKYVSAIRTPMSLLAMVLILLLMAVNNGYAVKNRSGSPAGVTKNDCSLLGGTLMDDLKNDSVMCCTNSEGVLACSACTDCTLEDVIIFPKKKNPVQPDNSKPAKIKPAKPLKVQPE